MFRVASSLCIVVAAVACSGSDGPFTGAKTDFMALAPFDAVALRADMDVEVWFGESEGVTLSGEPGSEAHYGFDVHDAVLDVFDTALHKPGRVRCSADLRMRDIHRLSNAGPGALTSPADLAGRIDEIEATGSGPIALATAGTDVLDVWLSGEADVAVGDVDFGGVRAWERLSVVHEGTGEASLRDVDLERVEIDTTSMGAVFVSGLADELDIHHEGEGTVGTAALISQRVQLQLTGGTTTIYAEDRVEGFVRGDATLVLIGPATVDLDVGPDARVVRR